MKLSENEDLFEQFKPASQWRGWAFVFLFSAAILAWGMVLHMVIPEGPRQWDFGSINVTPAASIYSTREPSRPSAVNPPRQMEALPGHRPLTSQPASTKAQ